MIRKLVVIALMIVASNTHAVELTTCRTPAGKAYFHFAGLIDKASSGWSDDKISKGVFTLVQAADGAFDVMYVDGRGKPISSTQDGALVRPLVRGANSVAVLVFYPSTTTEIYTFFKEKDGNHKFTLLQSKVGDEVVVPKSSLLVGSCDPLRLDLLK